MRTIKGISFRFLSREDPFSYAEGLASAMPFVQPQHVLNHGHLWQGFDAAETDAVLAMLTPARLVAVLASPAEKGAAPGPAPDEAADGEGKPLGGHSGVLLIRFPPPPV